MTQGEKDWLTLGAYAFSIFCLGFSLGVAVMLIAR